MRLLRQATMRPPPGIGAGAIFVIVRLAGAARIGGLCNGGSRRTDDEYENGEA